MVIFEYLGTKNKKETIQLIGWIMGGVLAAIGAIAINERAKAQIENNKLIEKGHIDERFKTVVEHFGNPATRQASYYGFYQLAKNHKHLRESIFNILCSHLREETGTDEYKEKAKERPTENIQSLLDVLFRFEHVFDGFKADLPGIYLSGANLENACMKNANFEKANLATVNFFNADLENAYFSETNLQSADFQKAGLQETYFWKANLQNANLQGNNLQEIVFIEADLQYAKFQGANLQRASFQGANLEYANFQRAKLIRAAFSVANLQHVKFWDASLQAADFRIANLKYTDFSEANLQYANFTDSKNMSSAMIKHATIDENTILPEGISHPSRE